MNELAMDETPSKSIQELICKEDASACVLLGRLCLQFGQVNRITKHPDGELESDTDHTFMLTMLACSFASKYRPDLDIGLIAQYATVHDFVEVYAGDTDTLASFDANQKHDNEEQALRKLKSGFDHSLPWVSKTIETYNRLDTPEARFVKFMDKILPKITHLLNGGGVIWEHGMSIDSINKRNREQLATIWATYGKDFPEVKELFEKMHGLLMAFLTTHQEGRCVACL